MLKRLLFLSFIEGAAVMAAELCGARLLAPIFGSSLYVWASVLGFTLAALAGGYFVGGQLASGQGDKSRKLFNVLNLASLFVLLMPVIGYYLVPRISYLPFLGGVILSTLLILFIPVFLLGASSPLLIALQTKDHTDAGRVSGTIYAVSTIGGIISTFVCGFYLVPVIGLNASLLLFGSALFLTNVITWKIFKPVNFFFFVFIFYANVQLYGSTGTVYATDGILGRLEVKDFEGPGKSKIRHLTINGIIQTEMDLKTGSSVSNYIQLLDTLIGTSKKNKKALVLGLGGGLTANMLLKKNYSTDAVEYDGRVIEAAKTFFGLNKNVVSINADARYFLNACNKKYDVFLFDLYKAEEQPSHVITMESLEKLKNNMEDSAIIYINWHGYLEGITGFGTSILLNTLKQSGFKVSIYSTGETEDLRNLVFVATLFDFASKPGTLSEKPMFSQKVNTDDKPLLEKYNAEANKRWRTNYLRYYQSKN